MISARCFFPPSPPVLSVSPSQTPATQRPKSNCLGCPIHSLLPRDRSPSFPPVFFGFPAFAPGFSFYLIPPQHVPEAMNYSTRFFLLGSPPFSGRSGIRRSVFFLFACLLSQGSPCLCDDLKRRRPPWPCHPVLSLIFPLTFSPCFLPFNPDGPRTKKKGVV